MAQIADLIGAIAIVVSLVYVGLADPLALRRSERVQFTWSLYEMFGSFECMYLQSREGALPADVWKRWERTMSGWLQWPGVQQWWRSQPTPFSASFAAFVESRIGAPVPDAERARLWAEFLSAPTRSAS